MTTYESLKPREDTAGKPRRYTTEKEIMEAVVIDESTITDEELAEYEEADRKWEEWCDQIGDDAYDAYADTLDMDGLAEEIRRFARCKARLFRDADAMFRRFDEHKAEFEKQQAEYMETVDEVTVEGCVCHGCGKVYSETIHIEKDKSPEERAAVMEKIREEAYCEDCDRKSRQDALDGGRWDIDQAFYIRLDDAGKKMYEELMDRIRGLGDQPHKDIDEARELLRKALDIADEQAFYAARRVTGEEVPGRWKDIHAAEQTLYHNDISFYPDHYARQPGNGDPEKADPYCRIILAAVGLVCDQLMDDKAVYDDGHIIDPDVFLVRYGALVSVIRRYILRYAGWL